MRAKLRFALATVILISIITIAFYKKRIKQQEEACANRKRSLTSVEYYKNDEEMEDRINHVNEICKVMEDDNLNHPCSYRSKNEQFNQEVGEHFIQEPNTGTIYCYIHKVFTLFNIGNLSFQLHRSLHQRGCPSMLILRETKLGVTTSSRLGIFIRF